MPLSSPINLSSEKAVMTPRVEISVNGKPASNDVLKDVMEVVLTQEIGVPGMIAIRLNNINSLKEELLWSDNPLFDTGKSIQVELGYNYKTFSMTGDIVGLEPEFSVDRGDTFTVRGYDLMHRLMRGIHTRSFVKMKESEIARELVLAAGVSVNVADSKVLLDYVVQHNQTNLAFLQERARRIGYEIWVRNGTLYFQPPALQQSSQVRLSFKDYQLLEVSARLSTLQQVNEYEVRGWDVGKKEVIVDQASKITKMRSGESGAARAAKAFGKASEVKALVVMNAQEAAAIGEGQLNERALSYITLNATTALGEPRLYAGMTVDLVGLGQRFSGSYYITSVIHRYSLEEGYNTEFSARRNVS